MFQVRLYLWVLNIGSAFIKLMNQMFIGLLHIVPRYEGLVWRFVLKSANLTSWHVGLVLLYKSGPTLVRTGGRVV